MNEREKKIAAGLAAAEQGQKDLSEAKSRADEVIKEARARALAIESQAQARANQIIEEARKAAASRVKKRLACGQVADRAREQPRARPAARAGGQPRGRRRQARAREARSTRRRTANCSTSWRRSSEVMAERITTARPYAKAIFALARKGKALAATSRACTRAADSGRRSARARAARQPARDARAARRARHRHRRGGARRARPQLRHAAGAEPPARIPPRDRGAVRADEGRGGERGGRRSDRGRRSSTPDQESRYAAALQKKLGRRCACIPRSTAACSAAPSCKAGDLVIDGSLKGRLERLAIELTA